MLTVLVSAVDYLVSYGASSVVDIQRNVLIHLRLFISKCHEHVDFAHSLPSGSVSRHPNSPVYILGENMEFRTPAFAVHMRTRRRLVETYGTLSSYGNVLCGYAESVPQY